MVAGRSLTLQASQARSGATQLTGSALSIGNALALTSGGDLPLPASPLFTRVSSLSIFKPTVYAGFRAACPQTPY